MRIIIDTNLWISILIGRRLGSLLDILDSPDIGIISSPELKAEVAEVLSRKKFAKYFTTDDIQGIISWLNANSEEYSLVPPYPERCRDPKDDYLLELARQSKADFLLTGDDDLLVLKQVGKCQIVSVRDFLFIWQQTNN